MYDLNKVNTHIVPVRFAYHSPSTLDEALELLSRYRGEAKVLMGGTDLLIKMKMRAIEPSHIISLRNVKELDYIEFDSRGVRIGAGTRLRTIEKSDEVRERFPALWEAVRVIGSIQIRNMGTVGGNLCNASPAADTAPPLIVYGAEAVIIGPRGERRVRVEEFFKGPGKTVLEPDEILREVFIPYADDSGSVFLRLTRTSMDIAKISIAVAAWFKDAEIIDCRIALGAVAPTPIRIPRAEEFLRGRRISMEVLDQAGRIVSEDIKPITDARSTAWYRRAVARVLTRDAFMIAWQRFENRRAG